MSIIQFKEANCKNCYKCIRHCQVKSISFQNEQAKIIDNECILCGHCFLVCPQNAKYISSDIEKVKGYIKSGKKVFASLAPSFFAAFPNINFSQISAALKKLGFARVEETAIGAAQVSAEYALLLKEKQMDNIITTCCPTIVMLVEKYYPDLIPFLAPVISPAMAHAKMMKNIYGSKIKVVFIGPCISKKHEASLNDNIDATLMFDELSDWLKTDDVEIGENDNEPTEMHNVINRLYPVPGGIMKTINPDARKNYNNVVVDGLDRSTEILNSLRDNKIKGYFVEMSACPGSCINGPGLKHFDTPFLIAKDLILDQAKKKTLTNIPISENLKEDFSFEFTNSHINNKMPDEITIQAILTSIGKTSSENMHNCGTCGYPTCRDKAIAVYNGKADIKMCLPFMRERAESMSNIILYNTPKAIFMVDEEFCIIEFNRAATTVFDMNDIDYIGLPIDMLIDSSILANMKKSTPPIIDHRQTLNGTNKTVEISVIPVPDNNTFIIIIKDISDDIVQNEKLMKMRAETIEIAQKVIDKQMIVAQEIASLLGETTGETKSALTKLKKSMLEGEQK